ncbi:MAG: aconitase X swivel domain-containing protein [Actinomycetota bacterium]
MADGRSLVAGEATGAALVLDEPLSLWGGLDPETGSVIEVRHPQHGAKVSGRVLVMPSGRGSSSSPSVLAEAILAGTAPAAIVMREADPIVALGAIVARELYGSTIPVIVVDEETYGSLRTGLTVTVRADEARAIVEPT